MPHRLVMALRTQELPRHPAVGALVWVGTDLLSVHGERLEPDRAAAGIADEPRQSGRVGVAAPLASAAVKIEEVKIEDEIPRHRRLRPPEDLDVLAGRLEPLPMTRSLDDHGLDHQANHGTASVKVCPLPELLK
jgi:hypothetical protein